MIWTIIIKYNRSNMSWFFVSNILIKEITDNKLQHELINKFIKMRIFPSNNITLKS